MTLRFGSLRVPTTVHWPRVETESLALVLSDELSPTDAWVETFVVIGLAGGHPGAVELAALQWVSDHVGEFGAAARPDARGGRRPGGEARAGGARRRLARRSGASCWFTPCGARSGRCRRTSPARRPRPWCAGHAATAAAGTRSGCAPPGSRFARCGMTAAAEAVLASGCHRAELTSYCRRMLGSSVRRGGRGAGDAASSLARFSAVRGPGSGPDVALPDRHERLPRSLGHAARRPIPVEDVPEPAGCRRRARPLRRLRSSATVCGSRSSSRSTRCPRGSEPFSSSATCCRGAPPRSPICWA